MWDKEKLHVISCFLFSCNVLNRTLPQTHETLVLFDKSFLFVLRFYGPVNPIGPCRARSVYLAIRLLGRLSPQSG